jgi:membrane associated rhomboid family serine protease
MRRYPVTAAITATTALVGAAQFAAPVVVSTLQRDPDLIRAGQWWRLLTAIFVQPSGWGQYVYNVLGIVLVGVAVERRCGRVRWLVLYLGAGLVGVVLVLALYPHAVGGGSSDAVAGLIGGLTVVMWRTGRLPPWPASLYAAHFASYLSVLAVESALLASVAGTAIIAVITATRRTGRLHFARGLLCVVVLTGTTLMAALGDSHGAGLLTGLLLAALTTGSIDHSIGRHGPNSSSSA